MTCPHLNCLVYHKNGVCNCDMEKYLGFKQGYSPNGNVKLSASANGDSLGDYKQSLIQWLEGEKYPRDNWKTCESSGKYFCLCGARIGKKDGRCIYCQTPYNQAIDTVIKHIQES